MGDDHLCQFVGRFVIHRDDLTDHLYMPSLCAVVFRFAVKVEIFRRFIFYVRLCQSETNHISPLWKIRDELPHEGQVELRMTASRRGRLKSHFSSKSSLRPRFSVGLKFSSVKAACGAMGVSIVSGRR